MKADDGKVKIIELPTQCPFLREGEKPHGFDWLCEECLRKGVIQDFDFKSGTMMRYDVQKCAQYNLYVYMVTESGLRGSALKHTFENATIDEFNRPLYTYLQEWDPQSGVGVYIAPEKTAENKQGNGTGKTYALHALTHRLCKERINCLYSASGEFLEQLKATYDGSSYYTEYEIMQRYINVPVLLLDDLGKENIKTDWAPERFYYLIDRRAELGNPTIYASNFYVEELEDKYGNNFGPAIVSRIVGTCKLFALGGPDRRMLRVKDGA